MAKTVAELQEEAKKKLEQEKKKSQLNQQDESKKLEEAMSEIAFLKAQTSILQEQLNKSSLSEEEKRLEQEAEKMKKEEEALRQEANLAQILDKALEEEHPKKSDEEGELSQENLVGIIAETVGKALDASSKLTMGEMDKKLAESNKQIAGLQKVVIDLLGGLSVEKARNKFGAEFDKYSEDAAKIHANHPTLSPEEAIMLAKVQAESKQPDKDKIETEKPSEPPAWTPDRPFSTSRESESSGDDHAPRSRREFKQQLGDAVDEYLTRKSK